LLVVVNMGVVADEGFGVLLKVQFVLTHMSGDQMPADHLTKLGNIQEHRAFTQQILGLTLLEKCNGSTTQVSHPTPFQQK
jgi:hypothetical protein